MLFADLLSLHLVTFLMFFILVIHNTVASRNTPTPESTPTHPFSLKVIAKGHLLLKSTPTQQTKIKWWSVCRDDNGGCEEELL